ncbi:DUF2115 domain-containing protein [Methanoregula sp.]|uniref:DUF2115 domain-containing protein n=1 Tax=Methanoregula sp. TaxID=2052170 RepID=UPI002C0FA3A5|nr:DUF2115 domain-containing protein [Methanoregula sp.]HVP95878.1 DUF2115 domain-containing protein [Methanoregula sp.]
MSFFSKETKNISETFASAVPVAEACRDLGSAKTRGELGKKIAALVLAYSPRDIRQMMTNFGNTIRDISPEYRAELETAITGHLLGTYQDIRLAEQQGSFARMKEPVTAHERSYWEMVAAQCKAGPGDLRLRFLKFLLAGYCMIVRQEPGHPVGMRFPGGDKVERIDGVYYCPVREKANDVDAALCPFCPAHQTPAVGYLKPPVNASEHRKQEFIDNCYRYHNFNG